MSFFPTCQVRVVRFYQSCSPRLAVLLVLVLLLLVLRLLLLPPPPVSPRSCLHQLPPQLPPCQLFAKLFANFPAQCAPLDLNLGPNQLSVHRWTSTWDLDLNLGPSQLSVHRWASTWDLPSFACTAGPQRPDRIPEDMPDRVLEDMSDRMPEDMPEHIAEDMPCRMPEDMPEDMLDKMPEDMSDRMPEDLPVTKRNIDPGKPAAEVSQT